MRHIGSLYCGWHLPTFHSFLQYIIKTDANSGQCKEPVT